MPLPKTTFEHLQHYTIAKAKLITLYPVKLSLVKTLSGTKTVARCYQHWFTPIDKTEVPFITSFEIELLQDYYNAYCNDPVELKSCIAHELAHLVTTKSHGKRFREMAISLGADTKHLLKDWD